ncbi:TPA: HNH endonuclease [Enterobacter cancerogenus]|nr:HNH endonuclease [Enterobacter cancerogenus]EKS7429766.1 HNH endonuclease [Enterobacter cancerogenus]HBI6866972.1 HNH endonuclease [Enterobacter cancerogenus]HBI6869689.1 HNH endonuclease [Enterobacter cancerogenus]
MASSKTLEQAIADITIWRKGEQRAPHKPLLLLYVLANYQQGHARLFDYGKEVRDQLHSLLERFGPQRAQYRPDMPFWRLQGDGFWELQNAERCSTSGTSKQPPAGELVEHHVAGGFDEQHYSRLINSKNLINSIAQQILEAHFTESIQEELADELGFDLLQIRKQRDPLFRQQVLRAYNYQCAVCGFNMRHDNTSVALEAAHIKWKQFGGPCEIANGLALCAIHHKAFDKGSLGVDENMRVQISSAVNGNSVVSRFFWDFAGAQIHLPLQKENYPQANYIEWHIREIFRK